MSRWERPPGSVGAKIIPTINGWNLTNGHPNNLFDARAWPTYSSQTAYMSGTSRWIDLTIPRNFNMYAMSSNSYTNYFPRLVLERWNGSAFVSFPAYCEWRGNNRTIGLCNWARFFSNIPAGRYRFRVDGSDSFPHHIAGEWFFEEVDSYLVECEGRVYTRRYNYFADITDRFEDVDNITNEDIALHTRGNVGINAYQDSDLSFFRGKKFTLLTHGHVDYYLFGSGDTNYVGKTLLVSDKNDINTKHRTGIKEVLVRDNSPLNPGSVTTSRVLSKKEDTEHGSVFSVTLKREDINRFITDMEVI